MFSKNLKKAALATAITASLGAGSVANASVIDNPVFQILGAVVVWGGDGAGGAMASDFIIDNGTGGQDLIGGGTNVTPVMTGSLDSFSPTGLISTGGFIQDADNDGVIDSLAEFAVTGTPGAPGLDVDGSAAQSSSFYVASNTVFNITATVTGDAASLNAISRDMAVTESGDDGIAYGANARMPYDTAAESAHILNEGALSLLSGGADVFLGSQSTAEAAGSIAEQSVRFTNTYSLAADAADFSTGPATYAAEVTYTIAIP